ncbi:hypothetical protein [Streptomyces sp. NBC_00829]|uniref:hypothetical protein n=1 Tax=Streptomyces sp. NBC_00829 TaxID=2903679 RepID=UPI0038641563|nr:hypothetical protein OG293_23265 [Streptomyces sp. NBC_00829]
MTDRLTVDTINSDQLDVLYERVAKAEQDADDSVAAATRLTTLVGKRSERAERAADKQRRRADVAETELRILRSGLRANGADPTQIQNLWAQIRLRNRQWREEKQRVEQAEAAIERVRALTDRWVLPGHISMPTAADDIRAALDEPSDTAGHCGGTLTHPGHKFMRLDVVFNCPGNTPKEPTT